MAKEDGTWIMRGLDWDDPARIQSWQELTGWVDEVGFLPLFRNGADGFSVEENTSDLCWWSDDPAQDPWKWRQLIARSGRVTYGRFFVGKAGFISRAWLPHFANWRRNGYDFDSRWDEGLAGIRQKWMMDRVAEREKLRSSELKRLAGFGREGEKDFEGTVSGLQIEGDLVIRDFRRRINRRGLPYGWPISVYTTPEALWGCGHVISAYAPRRIEGADLLADPRALLGGRRDRADRRAGRNAVRNGLPAAFSSVRRRAYRREWRKQEKQPLLFSLLKSRGCFLMREPCTEQKTSSGALAL